MQINLDFSFASDTFDRMRKRNAQLSLLKSQPLAYGGDLLESRKARQSGRPLTTKDTLHLVLRSSKAVGSWSFKDPENEAEIKKIVAKFCSKYHVRLVSLANVGNHLHFHLKLWRISTYRPFIRGLMAAIAMAVTDTNRWTKVKSQPRLKFWDCRPFTRVIRSFRALLNLRDYIRINELEGYGYRRDEARFLIKFVGHPMPLRL